MNGDITTEEAREKCNEIKYDTGTKESKDDKE